MSITIRRPVEPQDSPESEENASGAKTPGQKKPISKKPKSALRQSPAGAGEGLVVGGDPRVDLLPPEVRSARRNARTRRGFAWGVLAVFLVVVMASGGAFGLNIVAQGQLLVAQARTNELLSEQQKYTEVRNIQNQVDVAVAAKQVGASTEVAWQPFIAAVGSAEPPGLKMKSVTIDSASPIAVYQQSTDPLQGPRIATVTVVALSNTFPDVPGWLRAVLQVRGVVDATAGTVNRDDGGVYTSSITIHVGEALFTKRFETKGQ